MTFDLRGDVPATVIVSTQTQDASRAEVRPAELKRRSVVAEHEDPFVRKRGAKINGQIKVSLHG